jgi:hypothetical protein
MDMKPKKPEKRYVARVVLFDEWKLVDVMDNYTFLIARFLKDMQVPDYMNERIALLRMCDINKQAKGESIGRRTSDTAMLVYLNYDEYTELINLRNNESAK